MTAPLHLFTHQMTVIRATNSDDRSVSPVADFNIGAATAACRVSQVHGSEFDSLGRQVAQVNPTIYCEGTVDVKPGDRVQVWNDVDRYVFNVRSVSDADFQRVLKRLDCDQITTGV